MLARPASAWNSVSVSESCPVVDGMDVGGGVKVGRLLGGCGNNVAVGGGELGVLVPS